MCKVHVLSDDTQDTATVQVQAARDQTTEYTQRGNDQTYVHSIMIKKQPWVRVRGVHLTPFHSIYHHVQS
jgi:hypothetical protein